MRTVISVKEVQELVRRGDDPAGLPADALLTPSARDMLRDYQQNRSRQPASASSPGAAGAPAAKPEPDLERFFQSPELHALKLEICDIGRRLWQRAYVDGNGGNISIRLGDNLVLCTPTLISKGFMKPEDLCLVDLEGNQKMGTKKRTSEILMHLEIMKSQPKAKSVVHCHPPHSTAFAVAGIEPPTCMIPEFEVFCGAVPIAPYRTPGTPEMGKLVAALVDKHNTVLMANHGVVTWSHLGVEDAYWKMEIIEAYCRTVVVAAQLGKPLNTFSTTHLKDLLKIKQGLGIPDSRLGLKECELCDNSDWRPGVVCQVPQETSSPAPADPEVEAVVRAITEQILEKLK